MDPIPIKAGADERDANREVQREIDKIRHRDSSMIPALKAIGRYRDEVVRSTLRQVGWTVERMEPNS